MAQVQILPSAESKAVDARARMVHVGLAQMIERAVLIDRQATLEVLSFAVDDLGAGAPAAVTPFTDNLRADAAFWADCATPHEIEAYVGAGLAAIPRKTFASALVKKMLVNLWLRLDPAERQAFLHRVDPKGQFRAKGAA